MRLAFAAIFVMLAVGPGWADDTSTHKMSEEDFFLDRKDIIGQRVEIDAIYFSAGDYVYLKSRSPGRIAFVQIDDLPREVRKEIFRTCSSFCEAIVQGKVKAYRTPLGLEIGIVADDFSFQD